MNASMADAPYQNKVSGPAFWCEGSADWLSPQAIETILEHYTDIFVDESDAAA